MIVVYNKDTGDIIYTVERAYDKDFINKKENQSVLITNNEKIRANKHKVDLEKEKCVEI